MDLEKLGRLSSGQLVPISGHDPRIGAWNHLAFAPDPLPDTMPSLRPETYLQVADARAALAALDSTAKQLPNPQLLRHPVLRREAQSTSALEGTYAPLNAVLSTDEEDGPSGDLREILNYVVAAEHGFGWQADGRPLTVASLCELQRLLVRETSSHTPSAGNLRDIQVVIGRSPTNPIKGARFIPHPPGDELARRMQELVHWLRADHSGKIDPVVAAGMAHYQFETLHPFNDGNGRIGRLLIVMHLHTLDVLSEQTLTVSPWFEARRADYYDNLFGVSAQSDWDSWLRFFAAGIENSAKSTRTQMLALVTVQSELHERVRSSHLRADSAHAVIDFAVAHPSFTIPTLERELNLSYTRANKLVNQLVKLDILRIVPGRETYRRRFQAPEVIDVLLQS